MSLQPMHKASSLLEVAPEAHEPTLRLRLHLGLLERVDGLVQGMMGSDLFSQETKGKIQDWHRRFQEGFLPNLSTDWEKIRAANALCYLLFGAIRPVFLAQNGNLASEDILLNFEQAIQDILPDILPRVVLVGGFVERFETYFEEERKLILDIESIWDCAKETMEQLFRAANQANLDLKGIFDGLKRRLLVLNAQQRQSTHVQQRLDRVMARVEEVSQLLDQAAQEIAATGKEVEAHHSAYHRLRERCAQIMSEV